MHILRGQGMTESNLYRYEQNAAYDVDEFDCKRNTSG